MRETKWHHGVFTNINKLPLFHKCTQRVSVYLEDQ